MVKSKEEVINLSLRYSKLLAKLFDKVEVRLFGSFHHGNPTSHSDIDLAVISPDFACMDYILALKLLNRLKNDVAVEIEPIAISPDEFANPEPGTITTKIVNDSELIYKFPTIKELFSNPK